jgi:hypothetical protein
VSAGFVSKKQVKYLNAKLRPQVKPVKSTKVKPFSMKTLSPMHHRFTR